MTKAGVRAEALLRRRKVAVDTQGALPLAL
jgi:hypothetical protein